MPRNDGARLHAGPPALRRLAAIAVAVSLGIAGSIAGAGAANAADPRPDNGDGTVRLEPAVQTVEPGGTVTFAGEGFAYQTPNPNGLSIKIDDTLLLEQGVDVSPDGSFTGSIELPADITEGEHWLRFLGSSPQVSKHTGMFTVATETSAAPKLTVSPSTELRNGDKLTISGTGFDPSAEFKLYADEIHIDTVTTDAEGAFVWDKGQIPDDRPAGPEVFSIRQGDSTEAIASVTVTVLPKATVTVAPNSVRTGEQTVVEGAGLPEGSYAIKLGEQTLTENVAVPAAGTLSTSVTVPAATAIGTHQLALVLNGTPVASAELAVDPALFGSDLFTVERAAAVQGLYQTAYSEESDALFATSAIGRPPVKQSQLLKLDPDTLAIEQSITPAGVEGTEGVYAVYGVDVDDEHGNVWVTNTRQNTIAVYKQNDLSLVKQFPVGEVGHSRDVLIDEANDLAFVSAARNTYVSVYDTKTLELVEKIELAATADEFSPMSLELDEKSGKVYTVSLNSPKAAVIDVKTLDARVFDIGTAETADTASGVAYDAKTDRLFVANQGSNNLLIVNASDGSLVKDVPIGRGALNVAWDDVNGLAYVANRGSGTVAVVDAAGAVKAQLDGGKNTNHVVEDGKGNVFAVNKGGDGQGGVNDLVIKITPADTDPTDPVKQLPFKDVKKTDTHYKGIDWMYQNGYLAKADKFNAANPTTRGAMATMLMRINGDAATFKPKASTVKNWPYSDVKPGDTHYKGIAWMYENGYAAKADKFNPGNVVTRGAMATFLQRIDEPKYSPKAGLKLPYKDVTKTSTHYKGIAWMTENGYAAKADKFNPANSTTRGAMATFLKRIYG